MSRALPLQISVLRLIGYYGGVPCRPDDPQQSKEDIRLGRRELVEHTGVDFGYDIGAWRSYILANHRKEYEYAGASVDRFVLEAVDAPQLQALFAELADERCGD